MDTGLTSQAEAWLRRIVEVEPHVQVFLDLAHLAEASHRHGEAIGYSGRAVDLVPPRVVRLAHVDGTTRHDRHPDHR